jgi:hypothetical protein
VGQVVRLRRNTVTVLLPHSLEAELAHQNTPVEAAQRGGTGAVVFRLRIAPGKGPMRKCTRRPCTNPARLERAAIIRTLLLAALLVSPSASESQGPPQRPPSSSPSIGATAEMPADEIFSRFATRILFLTCDLSADDLKQASGVLISADGFLVTNAHVVEGCRSMAATLIDRTSRRSYEAALKYYDKKSDSTAESGRWRFHSVGPAERYCLRQVRTQNHKPPRERVHGPGERRSAGDQALQGGRRARVGGDRHR